MYSPRTAPCLGKYPHAAVAKGQKYFIFVGSNTTQYLTKRRGLQRAHEKVWEVSSQWEVPTLSAWVAGPGCGTAREHCVLSVCSLVIRKCSKDLSTQISFHETEGISSWKATSERDFWPRASWEQSLVENWHWFRHQGGQLERRADPSRERHQSSSFCLRNLTSWSLRLTIVSIATMAPILHPSLCPCP